MATPELVEREQLVDELARSLQLAAREGGRMVLLAGSAGVGKTSVVRAVEARTPAGVRRLTGCCDPLDAPQPLAPLLDMEEQSPRLARAAGSPRHERFTALLHELSTAQTLAVLEDVHWADAATADLLVHVARRVTRSRSLVLVTYRDDELGPSHPVRIAIDGMATQRGVVRRSLEPLSAAGVAVLAGDRRIDVEQLHRRTGGNPFFVTEVLAAPGWAVPPTVADAVRARARRLPPGARAVLDTVAVEAGPVRLDDLLALGHPPADVDAAVTSGMLVHADRRIAFRHELSRLGVLADLAPAARLERHRAWLRRLEPHATLASDAARMAAHAVGADDRDATLAWSREAAVHAAAHGTHREAATHLETALAVADRLPSVERATLLSALARELTVIERRADAVRACEEALALHVRDGRRAAATVARAELAKHTWGLGDGPSARRLTAEALADAERLAVDDPGRAASHALAFASAWAGLLAMLARDGVAARALSGRAASMARVEGLDDILVTALNALGSSMIVDARDLTGIERLQESRALAARLGDDRAVADALVNLGSALGEIREYERAARHLEEAIAFTTERDLDAAAHYVIAWLARVRFEQGRWDEAEALLTRLDPGRSTSPVSSIVGLTVLGRLRARRGEPVGTALEHAWELAQRTGDLQRLWPVVAARAEAAWLAGGSHEPVADDVAAVLATATEHGVVWARDELQLCLARLGLEAPRTAETTTAFSLQLAGEHAAAAAEWRSLGCPFELAWALADSGEESAMREALDILQRLGAAPLAARVRRRLRADGATAVPLGSRAATHPSGLTGRQLAVLELLAAGLTDRQIAERLFLSTKTVGHHVSAILATLGVAGRTAAARLAVERGWVTKMGSLPQVPADARP